MSDLLDIILGIDTSQIVTAKQEMAELGNSFNSATKSASVFEQAFAKAAAQSTRDNKFLSERIRLNQELINTNLKVSNFYKSAEESMSVFSVAQDKVTASYIKQTAAAEKAAAANAKAFQANIGGNLGLGSTNAAGNGASYSALDTELERLKTKYDSAYAASKLFEAQSKELNFALLNEAGNTDTLKSELVKLEAEYSAFKVGTTDLKNRFVQQTAAVEESRKGVNRWGLLIQQTGYQAGDFLVQVESGTNAFVAFGQQATQLVGILPMFSEELGISALALGGVTLGLSLAIPILTSIGAYFTRTGKGAKDAKGGIDDYTKAIQGLTSDIQKNEEEFLKAKFGTSNQNVANAKQQIQDLTVQIDTLSASINYLNTLKVRGAAGVAQKLSEDQKANQEELANLQAKLQSLQDQEEATRKLTDQARIKAAFELQHLQDLKDQQSVLEGSDVKANLLKNTFHAMAGETGAVSVSLNGWAGEIIAASDAASALSQYMYKVNNMANMSGRGLPANGMPANVMHDYGMESPGIDTKELFKNIDFGPGGASIKPKKAKGSGGAAGSGGGAETSLKDIYKYLEDSKKLNEYATKEEDTAYDQRQKALKSALSKRIISLKEYQATELDLTRKHEVALQTIENQGRVAKLSTVLGTGAQILTALGEHNAKAAKMAKVLGAAQALADTYAGAAAALKLPFPANLAAAGSIISAGLGFVASIQSGSSGGKPSATIPSTSTTATAAAQTATPQQVLIQGIKPTDIFTGEQLSQLFDSLYKENRARGMVFQVQR